MWMELSGANARRQRLPPHYYASSALQGRDSPFAHQIELVGAAVVWWVGQCCLLLALAAKITAIW